MLRIHEIPIPMYNVNLTLIKGDADEVSNYLHDVRNVTYRIGSNVDGFCIMHEKNVYV